MLNHKFNQETNNFFLCCLKSKMHNPYQYGGSAIMKHLVAEVVEHFIIAWMREKARVEEYEVTHRKSFEIIKSMSIRFPFNTLISKSCNKNRCVYFCSGIKMSVSQVKEKKRNKLLRKKAKLQRKA